VAGLSGCQVVSRAEAIDPQRGLSIGGHSDLDLRIHLGGSAAAGDIVAMLERHGGHVARGGAALGQTKPASGLGAMSSAARRARPSTLQMHCLRRALSGWRMVAGASLAMPDALILGAAELHPEANTTLCADAQWSKVRGLNCKVSC
jgi:hypothetical protein